VTDDERRLLDLARQGDTQAFGELVGRYKTAVFRAALAALRSPEEAEDVAQEAFWSAYRQLGTFRGEASFKTWVTTIAWRRALDRRGGLLRRLRRIVPLRDASGAVAAAGPDQEKRSIDADLAGRAARLIGALPASLRDPLLLFATGEHTCEEIGVLLGVPTGTVKWRLSQGRRRVRERLRRMGCVDE